MNRIAKFEKVSFEQFKKDLLKMESDYYKQDITDDEAFIISAQAAYGSINIPTRSSIGSAGYDFVLPMGFELASGQSIIVPTGIRCKIHEGWVLNLYPRSSLGFKTHVRLANTVGIIDSDYYNAANEGHIMVKLVADKPVSVCFGDRFCQGVFTPYGITEDDICEATRTGGFGSSGR